MEDPENTVFTTCKPIKAFKYACQLEDPIQGVRPITVHYVNRTNGIGHHTITLENGKHQLIDMMETMHKSDNMYDGIVISHK